MSRYLSYARYVLKKHGYTAFLLASLQYSASRFDDMLILLKNFTKKQNLRKNVHTKAEGNLAEANFPVLIPSSAFGIDIVFDKVAVIIHIFYPDLTEEIMAYVKNIPLKFGLFISTDTAEKAELIQKAINKSSTSALETTIKVSPNRGRDIAPMFIEFRDAFQNYPCFLHLHSKKSLHFKGQGDLWRQYLFNNLLGSTEIAESCLRILSSPNIGVVYPDHFEPIKKFVGWGDNYELSKFLLKSSGININKQTISEFSAGSMLWSRSAAVKKILDLKLGYDDFVEKKGQVDGTLAHALERSFLLFAEGSGFQWVKTTLFAGTEQPKPWRFKPLLSSKNTFET